MSCGSDTKNDKIRDSEQCILTNQTYVKFTHHDIAPIIFCRYFTKLFWRESQQASESIYHGKAFLDIYNIARRRMKRYNNTGAMNVQYTNTIELEISGRNALFTDPRTRKTPQPGSFPVPTYEAVKGILRSVYWKPTFIWVPDRLRVMERIRFEGCTSRLRFGREVRNVEIQRLCTVRYQIRAHFIWNMNRPEFSADRNENKHFQMALRALSRGGRMPVYLGTADCPCSVRSVRFGSGHGFYDNSGRTELGELHHSFTYPDEGWDDTTRRGLTVRSWKCFMQDGVIEFPKPWELGGRSLKDFTPKQFANMEVEEYAGFGSQD